jgi:DNA-binding XRE family transcriptional regulator
MILEGHIAKSGRFWAAEVASVGLFTQGHTRKQAEAMAADALETLAGKPLGASAWSDGDKLYVEAQDTAGLVAFVLRSRRASSHLTLAEVAKRIGVKSPNAYARYEQGRSVPTVPMLDKLLRAVDGRGLVIA